MARWSRGWQVFSEMVAGKVRADGKVRAKYSANDIDNSGGGYIIVGIEEENEMPKLPTSGLKKGSIDRIQKELLNKCNLIEPRYLPVVEPAEYVCSRSQFEKNMPR